jgi:hypothetical protein
LNTPRQAIESAREAQTAQSIPPVFSSQSVKHDSGMGCDDSADSVACAGSAVGTRRADCIGCRDGNDGTDSIERNDRTVCGMSPTGVAESSEQVRVRSALGGVHPGRFA